MEHVWRCQKRKKNFCFFLSFIDWHVEIKTILKTIKSATVIFNLIYMFARLSAHITIY